MARVVKEPEVRRAELLQTAWKMFLEEGYEDTPVQAITNAVGVAKGTFYHYFGSKEELLAQVVDWQAQLLVADALKASAPIEGRPLEELRLLIGSVLDWQTGIGGAVIPYLKAMYRPGNLPLRVLLTKEVSEHLQPVLEDHIAEGAEKGVFDVSDPEAVSEIIVAVWEGMRDELAELLLGAQAEPANLKKALAHLRALQTAMERVLGLKEGELKLFDQRKLRASFQEMTKGGE